MPNPHGLDLAAYELTQIETGQAFYVTHATEQEILDANSNLKRAGEALRYFRAGSFTRPSLHS